jgi:hypothetical protein
MLSAKKFISIVAERDLLPPTLIEALLQQFREMEQFGRQATAKDLARWLTKHKHLSPDVVEEIFRRAEDWAPDPSYERQFRFRAVSHDPRQQISPGDSRPVPMPGDFQRTRRDTETLVRSPVRTEQSTSAGAESADRREADYANTTPCDRNEAAPLANNTNVPQVDFGGVLPICGSQRKDKDSLIVPALLGFVAACCVIALTYSATPPRGNVTAASKAPKKTATPDRDLVRPAGETKLAENSAMIDGEHFSPTTIKQPIESSDAKPPPDKRLVESVASSDEKPSTDKPVIQSAESSDEKPPPDKPLVQPNERLQGLAAQALLPEEFDSVARDALKEASRQMVQGDRELATMTLRLALASARKSDNAQLVKTVVLCLLDARKGAKFLPVRLGERASAARRAVDTVDSKFPIPKEAERTKSRRNILEVYATKIAAAKDIVQKQALAIEFLRTAKETQKDGVARFVLLELAREEAVSGIDCPTALLAVDEMALSFRIRSIEIKAQTLESFALAGTATEHHKQLSEKASEFVEIALAEDNFEVAGELAKLAVREAEKTWYNQLLQAAIVRQKEVEEIQAARPRLNEFMTRLETTPDDPKCNLYVGKHQCFVRRDWDRGLLSLALGDDKQLQELAEEEVRGVVSTDEEVALGDRWWNLAVRGEKGPSEATKSRARYWYQQAHASLVGFMKDRVEQRLDLSSMKSLAENSQVPDPLLVGNWQVAIGPYKGRWTFWPNGAVVASGLGRRKAASAEWKMDSGIVLVRWTPETWSTLQCPLKLKDTLGDSWQGEKRENLIANKLLK